MNNKTSSESSSSESLVEMSRLSNLSDGVFAIAITLLAFDLRLPDSVPNLPNQLLELGPKFIVYMISFVVIGGAWIAHQRMLHQIQRGDGLLVWFNLACLLFVALVPATAAILGRYPKEFLAITVFALDVALIQFTTLWLWRHASRQDLINPTLHSRVVKSIGRRLSLSAVIFVLSIPLALWNIWITYLFWVGLFVLLFTTDWLSWQLAGWKQQTSFPLDNAKRASIHVRHEAGILRIDSKTVETILLNGVFGGGLESHVDRTEEAATIQLRAPAPGFLSWWYPWSWGADNALDWSLHLSNRIPIVLDLEINSGESMLELGALQITDLKLKMNTSPTEIFLPDHKGRTAVNIEAKTSMLILHIPEDTAASIHNEIVMAELEVDLARFPMIEEGREYISKRYKTASKRVDIRIGGTMNSVKIV